ncbi:MAG: restriction endonuclease subunit S [Sulfurimicrobium sp.]|nr:restriction endonuclease subunit S [Sulfurimicrobium sp.]
MRMVERSIADALNFYNGKAATFDESGEIEVFGSNGKIGFSKNYNHECAIILGRVGAYCGSVILSENKFWATDNTIVLKVKNSQSLRYWFYRLGNFPIRSFAGGAAQPLMTHGILKGINIKVHSDFDVQEKIADILSAYDDLIENNQRRMALLEESARLLYSEWFVRLRFPGYEHTRITDGAPEGWERKTLGECITLNYGKALKAEIRIDGEYPVYGSSGIVGSHEKPLVKGPAIILGRKGNVGSVYWSSKSFYPIDTVYFVDAESSSLYLYYALKHMHFISTDVAVPGLNRDFAYSRPLLLPAATMLRAFLENVTPIHAQLDKLDEMNQKLRAARDLLLPRLMSGELAV